MICHEKEFVFIDICRCAGTSIISALSKRFKCIGKHHSIRNITAKYHFCTYLTQHEINNYFKFVFVRNPFDRLLSVYRWRVTGKYRRFPFKEYIIKVREKYWNEYNGHRFIPMYDWIVDKQGNSRIDFIGRYESLQYDFNRLCDKLGIQHVLLERLSYGKDTYNDGYRKYYDNESREIVTEMYQRDLDYFGYRF